MEKADRGVGQDLEAALAGPFAEGEVFGEVPVAVAIGPETEEAIPQSASHIANVAAAMRPYLPGAAYVNYCDLDLQNWADAYWGANLSRLSAVKAAYDSDNLFHHAQSVPVGSVV